MAESGTKLAVKTEGKMVEPSAEQTWWPFETLRHEINRLFEDFGGGFRALPARRSVFEPFWQRELPWTSAPAVDIAESDAAYEITAELPGMDEKNIEVKVANGGLTIKGKKEEEREEKKKGYYLQERQFGSFERSFRVPEGVDANKIEAAFKKGVLTVTLPKTPEAQKSEKKITVKAA